MTTTCVEDLILNSAELIMALRETPFPDDPQVTYLEAAKTGLFDNHPSYAPNSAADLLRAQDNFARQLFEVAMLQGSTHIWREARSLEPEIGPAKEFEFHGIYLNAAKQCHFLSVDMVTEAPELSWQRWRHAALVDGTFTDELFPCYANSDHSGNYLRANQRHAIGTQLEIAGVDLVVLAQTFKFPASYCCY